MTGRDPSPEDVERCTRLVRGVEKVLLSKANWLVRRTTGLNADETQELAELIAEILLADRVDAR